MSGAEITVRWAHLDVSRAQGVESVLAPDELGRAAAFSFDRDRRRFVVARALLRTLLGERLGLDARQVEIAYGPRGKPRLAREGTLRFSLSHSNGVAAIALCEGREVGIDVEALRDDLPAERLAQRFLPAPVASKVQSGAAPSRLREFFRGWVRQEAYAKGRGAGLELIGQTPDPGDWTVLDLKLLDGFAAAVAVQGPPPPRLDTRHLDADQVLRSSGATAPGTVAG